MGIYLFGISYLVIAMLFAWGGADSKNDTIKMAAFCFWLISMSLISIVYLVPDIYHQNGVYQTELVRIIKKEKEHFPFLDSFPFRIETNHGKLLVREYKVFSALEEKKIYKMEISKSFVIKVCK